MTDELTESDMIRLLESKGYSVANIDVQSLTKSVRESIDEHYEKESVSVDSTVVGYLHTLQEMLTRIRFNSFGDHKEGYINIESVPTPEIRRTELDLNRNPLMSDILSEEQIDNLETHLLDFTEEIREYIKANYAESLNPNALTEEDLYYKATWMHISLIESLVRNYSLKKAGRKFNSLLVSRKGSAKPISLSEFFDLVEYTQEDSSTEESDGSTITISANEKSATVDISVYQHYNSCFVEFA